MVINVLLVEDDVMLGSTLQQNLQREHYRVEWIRDGLLALQAVQQSDFQLVVLDLGLPGCDGIEVLQHIRSRFDDTPVMVLTARDQISDRIKGLDTGADDYLVKPFDLNELLARLRVMVRRRESTIEPHIHHLGVTLDPYARKIWFGGNEISLTTHEYSLLLALIERPGRVWSRNDLSQRLGKHSGFHSNSIEVHIHSLRRKLIPEIIRSVRGVGYFMPKALY